jgi:hypothetical protein
MSLSELNKAIDITFKRKDGTEDHWFEKDGILYWHLGKENITLNMGKTKYQDHLIKIDHIPKMKIDSKVCVLLRKLTNHIVRKINVTVKIIVPFIINQNIVLNAVHHIKRRKEEKEIVK